MTTKRNKSKVTKKKPATKTKAKAAAPKARKATAKPVARRSLSAHTVALTDRARKVVRAGFAELVDRSLLEIAADQYSKLLRQVARQRKRLDKDRQAALEVGERILERAKAVSASLVRK